MGIRAFAALVVLVVLVGLDPGVVSAGECRIVQADFLPVESQNPDPGLRRPLQIVAWVEDPSGHYLETVFITQQTGSYGLGNRPGRFDFNSAPNWPYGRRTTVFPIWAHRHGVEFMEVVFQNAMEDNLSHPFNESSREPHYCAPIQRGEPEWDTGTCASVAFTDKGVFSATGTSNYPPRRDVIRQPGTDSASVELFAMMNPFDSVSMASPISGAPAKIVWPLEPGIATGDYVMWIEVAREFDHNATYSTTAYPSPALIPYAEWGQAYRGQPSVVYRVPFTIGTTETTATTMDYVGYSDPDGLDGNLRAPDNTITIDTPGSGAGRFGIVPGGGYRVRVVARPERDDIAPDEPRNLSVVETTSQSATLSFVAPGDDGDVGTVKEYEVRYRVGDDLTDANFDASMRIPATIAPEAGGTLQTFTLDRLLPETDYSIGIRAVDDCQNTGPLRIIRATTTPRVSGEVDACFIATAAYGSVLANDVELLRRFRDLVLQKSVLGELFVETYYTFGPAVAGVIGESEMLRETARAVLAPIVATVRAFAF
jgi:hypothetical protein